MITEKTILVEGQRIPTLTAPGAIQERQGLRLPNSWHEWFAPANFLTFVNPTDAKLVALYLTFLEEVGRPATARRAVPISIEQVKIWRGKIDAFEDLEEDALEGFKAKLHAEMVKRAVDGHQEPVFYQGAVAGYITRRSDRILELMARGHMPEQFGDKIAVTQTIQSGVLAIPAGLTPEEWMQQHAPKPLTPPSPIDRSQAVDVEVVNEELSSTNED